MIKIEELTIGKCLPTVYEVESQENDYVGINVFADCKRDTIKGGGLDGMPILRGQHVHTYHPNGYFVPSKPKDSNGLVQIGGKFKGQEEFLFTNLKEALKKYNELVDKTINEHLKQVSLNDKERIKILSRILKGEDLERC